MLFQEKDSSEDRKAVPVALLLIDVINDLDFEEGDALLKQAVPTARRLASLKREASRLQIPAIYANDNFGQWKSDFRQTVAHCSAEGSRGQRFRAY